MRAVQIFGSIGTDADVVSKFLTSTRIEQGPGRLKARLRHRGRAVLPRRA